MIAVVQKGVDAPVFMLKDQPRDLFALSRPQIEAVREFLLLIRHDPEHGLDRTEIESALSEPWR